LGHAGIRFKDRPAGTAELHRILPQARHNPIAVGYLIAAKPENVGGAGELLFNRPAILLRKSRSFDNDAERGR
jgi:hypothetical protein